MSNTKIPSPNTTNHSLLSITSFLPLTLTQLHSFTTLLNFPKKHQILHKITNSPEFHQYSRFFAQNEAIIVAKKMPNSEIMR